MRSLLVLALLSSWHVIGQGQAVGKHTIAAASGTAIKPAAIRMRVTASPNIRTAAGYSIQCRRGRVKRRAFGKTVARTPIRKAVPLPMAHPDVCHVFASATLASKAKLTVTILAR